MRTVLHFRIEYERLGAVPRGRLCTRTGQIRCSPDEQAAPLAVTRSRHSLQRTVPCLPDLLGTDRQPIDSENGTKKCNTLRDWGAGWYLLEGGEGSHGPEQDPDHCHG